MNDVLKDIEYKYMCLFEGKHQFVLAEYPAYRISRQLYTPLEIIDMTEEYFRKYGVGKYHFVSIEKVNSTANNWQQYRFRDGLTIDIEKNKVEINKIEGMCEWLPDAIVNAIIEYKAPLHDIVIGNVDGVVYFRSDDDDH